MISRKKTKQRPEHPSLAHASLCPHASVEVIDPSSPCWAEDPSLLHPQVMQVVVWVVSTVLLKFMLSTVLCASDDVRVRSDGLKLSGCARLRRGFPADKVTQGSEGELFVAGSHQRAHQVQVHELQGLSHAHVHVCCRV